MSTNLLKSSARVIKKNELYLTLDENNKIQKFKPWLGDLFSFLYDTIMEKSVFPKKFNGSIQNHFNILRKELNGVQGQNILEIATGSGNAVHFLNPDNLYTGIDISPGLLRRAAAKFRQSGFLNADLFIADALHTPFKDQCFDMAVCNLSLNFFGDIDAFISELKRVLKPGAGCWFSVPVPEKKKPEVTIRGTLYSEEELRYLFQDHGFDFAVIPEANGAVLYFKVISSNNISSGKDVTRHEYKKY